MIGILWGFNLYNSNKKTHSADETLGFTPTNADRKDGWGWFKWFKYLACYWRFINHYQPTKFKKRAARLSSASTSSPLADHLDFAPGRQKFRMAWCPWVTGTSKPSKYEWFKRISQKNPSFYHQVCSFLAGFPLNHLKPILGQRKCKHNRTTQATRQQWLGRRFNQNRGITYYTKETNSKCKEGRCGLPETKRSL